MVVFRYSSGRGSSGQYVVGCQQINDISQLLNANKFLWKSHQNNVIDTMYYIKSNFLNLRLHQMSIFCHTGNIEDNWTVIMLLHLSLKTILRSVDMLNISGDWSHTFHGSWYTRVQRVKSLDWDMWTRDDISVLRKIFTHVTGAENCWRWRESWMRKVRHQSGLLLFQENP